MNYFVTKSGKTYTLLSFLNTWGGELRKHKKYLPLEKLVRSKKLFPGTYFLSDFDLLNPKQIELLEVIYEKFREKPNHFKLLNQPGISIKRIDFLRKLFDQRINKFRCFAFDQKPKTINYPVFIRKGVDHNGKITDLFHSADALEACVRECNSQGYTNDKLLVTEFVDTSDTKGIFRKYSAFIVDDIVIPRHIFYSKTWMIKGAKLAKDYMIDEELNYLKTNPHKDELKAVFQLAGIKYGRIDYSLKNNKIVIWEINSNPMIASSSSLKKSKRKAAHDIFAKNFIRAFKGVDIITNRTPIVNPIRENTALTREAKQNFRFHLIAYLASNFYQNIKSFLLFNFYSIRNKFRS